MRTCVTGSVSSRSSARAAAALIRGMPSRVVEAAEVAEQQADVRQAGVRRRAVRIARGRLLEQAERLCQAGRGALSGADTVPAGRARTRRRCRCTA